MLAITNCPLMGLIKKTAAEIGTIYMYMCPFSFFPPIGKHETNLTLRYYCNTMDITLQAFTFHLAP